MSLYDINFNDRMTELTPPNKRLPKFLAWVFCIVYPLQWLRDLFFGDYKLGATYPLYNPVASYNAGDRVINTDKSVYECQVNGTISGTAGPSADPAWVRIQDLFIGTDERVKYNSQIILFEYALNHYYQVPQADPQIYILVNPQTTTQFIMGNASQNSSYLVTNPIFATSWMSNTPVFTVAPNFTIFVPSALFATLGVTTQDQENNVRQFANKYKLAGMTYDVQTF